MTQRKLIRTVLAVGALGLLAPATASAADIYYQLVADCDEQADDCGPRGQNDGPGHEQARGMRFEMEGRQYVAFVAMSSKAIPNRDQGPYQCRGWVWEITSAGPLVVTDGLLLTNNQGNRPCNHPDLKFAGGSDALFVYGTNDANNANVQVYAQVLDARTLAPKGNRTRFSDNNGNDGAADAIVLVASPDQFPTTYPKRIVIGHNNNGDDYRAYGGEIQADGSLNTTFENQLLITPTNITRSSLAQISADGVVVGCSAKGDERPPEDGNYCQVFNGISGEQIGGDQVVMATNENVSPRVYANSIYIAPVKAFGDLHYAMNLTSTGTGRNNNDNGSNRFYVDVIRFTPDYQLEVVGRTQVGIGAGSSTHGAIAVGAFGEAGAFSALALQGSISGSGVGVARAHTYDAVSGSFIPGPLKVTTAYNSDVAELANQYGNNPNTQGRDFISGVGDIPNPGFGIEGGFMSDSQTLFALPSYGKGDVEEYKNSMYLTLFSGSTPGTTLPPDETPDDPNDPNDPNDPDRGPGSSGGCSVTSTSHGLSGLVLMLGAMVLVVRRRRRK